MPKLSSSINTLLAILIIAITALSLYELRRTWHDFKIVEVHPAPLGISAKAHKLDQLLHHHIAAFSHIRSFDHLLKKKPYDYHLSTLWVDRCEVRQGDFYKFVKWQQQHPQKVKAALNQPPLWKYHSTSKSHKVSGRLRAPANGISYYDASAYCKTANGRLPTRSEWLAIAGGKEQRLYPWGDDFSNKAWPYLDSRLNGAQSCGLHKEQASPEQIHGLGDTVSEWASPDGGDKLPSLHGGNAYNKPPGIYSLTSLYRHAPPTYRSPYVGFRCVYDQQPALLPWNDKALDVQQVSPGQYTLGLPQDARIPKLLVHMSKDKIKLIKDIFEYAEKAQPFYILSHEVTRAQYREFLNDPLVKLGIYANEKEPEEHSYRPDNWSGSHEEQDALPVNNIDWWSAWAYANWVGGDLPSVAEWINAATGGGTRIYPWGNHFDANLIVAAENKLAGPQTLQTHAGDVTHNQIYQLGGNVSEWTRTLVALSDDYVAIVKGGNYSLPGEEAGKADFENYAPLSLRSPRIGFRIIFRP